MFSTVGKLLQHILKQVIVYSPFPSYLTSYIVFPSHIQPLIPGSGLLGQPFDGRRREQWQLQRWNGGTSSGGVPASDGSSIRFLRADGLWATPPGSGGGTRWWSGDGPPGVLPDAQAGDFYLDTRSGDLYQLELS